METRIDEIADGIYRLSTFVPTSGRRPGSRSTSSWSWAMSHCCSTPACADVPAHSRAVSRIIRRTAAWITFGHYEADECGAMNEWLAVAPRAEVAHGQTGCIVSLNDMADRPPRILGDGEVIDLGGGKRVRYRHAPYPAWLGGRPDLRGGHRHLAVRRSVHPGWRWRPR